MADAISYHLSVVLYRSGQRAEHTKRVIVEGVELHLGRGMYGEQR